jgi:hypothetical protein
MPTICLFAFPLLASCGVAFPVSTTVFEWPPPSITNCCSLVLAHCVVALARHTKASNNAHSALSAQCITPFLLRLLHLCWASAG